MTSRPSHEDVVATTDATARSMTPQRVPVNAYTTPGAFVIVAPIPGVVDSDVSVELTRQHVRFWAELRSAGPRDYVLHEWEYGGYERTVDLPPGYGADVEALLTSGQLVVRVLSGDFAGDTTIQLASD
ncbi:MAG: Hsp20 family protein [Ilumatobacter sp.]|nr:Hsp20 family protein [Ilumatobacter sp.]